MSADSTDARLSVVIPVYNSETTIAPLVRRCTDELVGEFPDLEFVLVNDGSRDGSDAAVRGLLEEDLAARVRYVRLAKNFGEHNAVMCGLGHATGGRAVIIDDDFQNPPEEIAKLVRRLDEGYDVVYSFYEEKHHNWFRNLGSRFNDRVACVMLKKPSGLYLSSFKAVNRFTIDCVTSYAGPFPYLDGLILRSTRSIGTQLCRHDDRAEGRSNYTLRRLVSLWLNMFTSFSIAPLRLATYLGLGTACLGLLLSLYFVVAWSLGGVFASDIPRGWASLIVSVTLFSGIQLFVLGVLGEYVGRIFMTINRQPQWVVRECLHNATDEGDHGN